MVFIVYRFWCGIHNIIELCIIFTGVYTILYIVYHVYCGMHNIIYCMSLKHVYIKLSAHDAYCGYLETFGDTKGDNQNS